MNYNLLICSSTKEWMAIDINEDGNCDRISFEGNDTIEINSGKIVDSFCTQILNYYNIDDFNDIEIDIRIVLEEFVS